MAVNALLQTTRDQEHGATNVPPIAHPYRLGAAADIIPKPNMNYSNMIEEKNLKKTFIVATLVSTLVGTFTASMALADKIQEKRDKSKQKATDGKQNGEIKQLEEKMKKLEAGHTDKKKDDSKSQRSSSRSSRSSSRPRRRRRDDYDDEAAYFAYSARRSRAMIEQAYEDKLARVGQGYARGDVITENKLQAQIIQLQQTVINVLQDALYNNRSLTEADLQRLLVAQQAAREGSLDALEGQYAHMRRRKQLPAYYDDGPAPSQQRLLEDTFAPPARQQTFPSRQLVTTRALPPPRRAESLPLPVPTSGLFCRYSELLQSTSRPLSPAFDPSADSCCNSCYQVLPVDARDIWVLSIDEETSDGRRRPREAERSVPARFVVKCHTPDARFACVLCNQYRDTDCICRSVEALVKHLAAEHTAEEFEGDADLRNGGY